MAYEVLVHPSLVVRKSASPYWKQSGLRWWRWGQGLSKRGLLRAEVVFFSVAAIRLAVFDARHGRKTNGKACRAYVSPFELEEMKWNLRIDDRVKSLRSADGGK